MIVRNRSWPAVSQICSFTLLPSRSMVRILKSMPIVVMNEGVKLSSENRSRQHDFPTPESPIRSSFIYTPWSAGFVEGAGRCQGRADQKVVVPCAGHGAYV